MLRVYCLLRVTKRYAVTLNFLRTIKVRSTINNKAQVFDDACAFLYITENAESAVALCNLTYLLTNLLVCKHPDSFLCNSVYQYRFSLPVDSF